MVYFLRLDLHASAGSFKWKDAADLNRGIYCLSPNSLALKRPEAARHPRRKDEAC